MEDKSETKVDLQALAFSARTIAAKIIPPTMPLMTHQLAIPPQQHKRSKSVTKGVKMSRETRRNFKKGRDKLAKQVLAKYRGKVIEVVPAGLAQQVAQRAIQPEFES